MSGRTNGHKSHISSKSARGWENPTSWSVRQDTLNQIEGGDCYMAQNLCSFSSNLYTSAGNTLTTYTDSSTSAGDWYYLTTDYSYWQSDWNGAISPITIIREQKEVTKVDLRTLYKVYAVDPRKNGELVLDKAIIADSKEQAMLKAGVAEIANGLGIDVEDLDVYVDEIGTFIRPKKKTQKVKIVKEDEEG